MKKVLYFLIFLLIPFMSDAQRWKHERIAIYGGVGTNFFLGDLGGGAKDAAHYFSLRDIDWAYTRPVIQGGIRYRIIRDLSVKPYISYARVKADDAESQSIGRQSRNLHFRTNIWEAGTQFEYYFIKEKNLGRYTFSSYKGINKLSAYVALGGGVFYYNPKSELVRGDGNWVKLRPLQNENVAYGYVAGYFSVGLGMKYDLTERWSLGIDFSNRYTTTDYLDDASDIYTAKGTGFDDKHLVLDYDQGIVTDIYATPYPAGTERRGDPAYKDSYFFTVITGYYKINSVFSMPKY
jgi:hypothetical protein